jgi:glyoxylase-like metal-dependent hydrolase (beta-lactamase superfamily II)
MTNAGLTRISENLFRFTDTCNVYVLRSDREAVAIDFGDGGVLGALPEIGVDRISDVLMTHHHRDQAQGLPRAAEVGARIWVPPVERELFDDVDAHWQGRELYMSYNGRQDRFSLLTSVPIAGTLPEYRSAEFGGFSILVVPTPGHTIGSVTYIAGVDGQTAAFTGDLIAAPGKVWSLAATQWTYNGGEGIAGTIISALDLKDRGADTLLPSHGEPITDPPTALDLLVERLHLLNKLREQNPRLLELRERPYSPITPHLLRNRTSNSNSYVLLSESGKALVIDYGYDFAFGSGAGNDRASRRPWLQTIAALKRAHRIDRVDVAIATHYHDDHVAGFNLLRDVEGTRIWAGENFAHVMTDPARFNLPCLWYDPIPVDRSLPLGRPVRWEEYELTVYELPGHTLYAVAIGFEVDGKRVLAVGDQQNDATWMQYVFQNQIPVGNTYLRSVPPPRQLNYAYANGFAMDDFVRSAELYLRENPDLMLFGHWPPCWVDLEYLAELKERGELLRELHRELLPLDDVDFGAGGFAASIEPYQSSIEPGEVLALTVRVRNPFSRPAQVNVSIVAPLGWEIDGPKSVDLAPRSAGSVLVRVCPRQDGAVNRARVAADISVDGRRFGQQAEAVVSVR